MLTLYAVGVMHTNPPIHIIVVFVEDGKFTKKKKKNQIYITFVFTAFLFLCFVGVAIVLLK
jgi:hypothetical protein